MLVIKKPNLIKLIKFSKIILISNNHLYFVKESIDGEIIEKSVRIENKLIEGNFLVYIAREIKKELDKLVGDIKINITEDYIYFNDVKIELIKAVVKYDR